MPKRGETSQKGEGREEEERDINRDIPEKTKSNPDYPKTISTNRHSTS